MVKQDAIDNDISRIATRIRKCKNSPDFRTERQFARDLETAQQNINRYLKGTIPKADFIVRLCRTEGISSDWLLMGRGPMHAEGWPK
jgi:hypothetical protein